MSGAPSSSVGRRTLAALGLTIVVALTGACTTSGSSVSSGAPQAPSATSGSNTGGSTTEKRSTSESPSSKSPSSKSPTTRTSTTADRSSTTEADPAALTPACDLLREEDVVEAFGEPVVAGEQDRDECWWATDTDLKTVNLIRRTEQDIEEWRAGYQNSSWSPIDLGDEGYTGKVLDSITFRLGDTTYEVNVIYSTKGDPEQVVQDLTDKVTGRL